MAIVAAGAVALRQALREPLLLDRATKAMDTSSWSYWTSYRWVTDQELLLFGFANQTARTPAGHFFYMHDIATGKETVLSELTRRASHFSSKHSILSVSPDGQRVTWTDGEGAFFYASKINGNGVHPNHRTIGQSEVSCW
jgi:hypothetical protein